MVVRFGYGLGLKPGRRVWPMLTILPGSSKTQYHKMSKCVVSSWVIMSIEG